MSTDCKEKYNPNRVKRDGVHQGQRLTPPLDPGTVNVDEHQPAHWMVFAKRYARYLKFFNLDNQEAGDWERFFSSDPAALLATAAIANVDFYKIRMKEFFSLLNNLDNKNDDPGLTENFGLLFSCVGTLAWQMDRLQSFLPEGHSLKAVLHNLIKTQLAPAFSRLVRYYEAANTNGLLTLTDVPDWDILGSDIELFTTILDQPFSRNWTDGVNTWAVYRPTLTADSTIFITAVGPEKVFKEINHVATHNLFTHIFDLFLKAYSRTVAEANKSLEATFTSMDSHEPHYALFLAFLRLLTYARDHANTLTARHLDYYYREILQLKEKPAEPNHAHVLVELAKHKESHHLLKDTPLKAGKDSLGKDVSYSLDQDFVANKASVAELKTVFQYLRKTTGFADLLPATDDGRLFASPVANSADGLGAEITTADKQWHPFANKIYEGEALKSIAMPQAEVGFAVASHHFLLGEGNRFVFMLCKLDDWTLPDGIYTSHFSLALTGKKGWLPVQSMVAVGMKNFAGNGPYLIFLLSIPAEEPAIVPHDVKVHKTAYGIELPMLKLTLTHTSAPYIYQSLKNLKLEKISLFTGTDKLQNLTLSNDFGEIDPSKPFQPFGAIPKKGASLVIGCQEIFQKTLFESSGQAFVFLNMQWQDQPVLGKIKYVNKTNPNTTPPNASLDFLKNGDWTTGQSAFAIFTNNNGQVFQLLNGLQAHIKDAPDFSAKEPYSVEKKRGFFRLRLNSDFGNKNYQDDNLAYILSKLAADKPPFEPYSPVIESLSIGYWAKQEISLNVGSEATFTTRTARFLHLHPFGHSEEHPHLSSESSVSLLPRFVRKNQQRPADELCLEESEKNALAKAEPEFEHEAEFYIGLKDLKPPQNLSLLFQLAEGSANPKTTKPDDHVQWSYLGKNNRWIPFLKDEVNDRTDQLMRSGIITFSFPRDVSDETTILPAGVHWLRAAIARRKDENGALIPTTSDAVCKIIAVSAQATAVTLKGNDYAPDYLKAPLPAGTIAKLLMPQAEVKKVSQPYPTFGGRPAEESSHFYTRISERLRHKNRAITVWDYERMVLEAFPHIYKVKCLNHTLFVPTDTGIGKYNELAPGHVTVIAIPNLRNHNAIDPLRPYTNLGDLKAIGVFLRKYVSCFVHLHVHNPVFEPVRVAFCVKFFPGTDEGFHLSLLRQKIVRFLSPWAFEAGKEVGFGGKIYKSSLINFIEEQPYVDYLTDFQLFHSVNAVEGPDREEAEASTAISILVSAAAEKHTIRLIPNKETLEAPEKCNC